MDRTSTATSTADHLAQCEDGLRLRRHLNKLRWMRLDDEAERLARKIARLDCTLPKRLAAQTFPTD